MSTPLHLVRTQIDSAKLSAFAAENDLLDDDLGYALHLALRRHFGAAAPQPFRLMPQDNMTPDRTLLLGYCTDPAGLVSPLTPPVTDQNRVHPSTIFPEPFATRAMPGDWRENLPLRFEVRLRPVRRHGSNVRSARAAAGKTATGTEHDAYLSTVENLVIGSHDHTRENVYLTWLKERLGDAATLDAATLMAFRRTRVHRSLAGKSGRGRNGNGIEGPDALIEGKLTIRNVNAFERLLSRGIGRHVAFGFGMLLLRPGA